MSTQPIRACLITNPRGGRGAMDLTEALPVLRDGGWDVTVRQKQHGDQAIEIAREAARDGYDIVVDCGGDGTLNEIITGVLGTDVAVGVLPGGTVNLWARELGIDKRLRVAAMQLVGAVRHRVDVGCLTINGKQSEHFLLVAGLGLDGAVMARVSKPLKRRIGPLAMGVAALKALPSFNAVAVRAMLDDQPWEGRIAQVIVGNTRRYGGFTQTTPGAYMDDGQLDVCLITAGTLLDTGRQIGALLLEQHPSTATAETHRVARLTIEAPQALPAQTDGGAVDLDDDKPGAAGMTYTFSVIAQGVSVLVPRTYDGALFQDGTGGTAHIDRPAKNKKDGKQGRKWRRLRVLAVGANTITAARVADARVVTIARGRKAVAKDMAGKQQPWPTFLAGLVAGDLLRVKGKMQPKRGRLQARRVRQLPPETTA